MRVLSCARRDPVHRLAFSADGRFLAANQGTVYQRGIEVFDFAEPDAPTKRLTVDPVECCFRFLPDRPTLAVAEGNAIRGFDPTASPADPVRLVPDVLYPAAAFDVTADGRLIVGSRTKPHTIAGKAGYLGWARAADGTATRLWRSDLGADRDVLADATALVGDGAFAAAEKKYNPERNEYDSFVILYDAATGQKRRDLRHDPTAPVAQLASAAASGRLVARCDTGLVAWDTTAADPSPREVFRRRRFRQVAFHPSGTSLAAVNGRTSVSLIAVPSFAVAKTFAWGIGPLHSVAFSADGTLGAAGSGDGRIVVWDAEP
jgi:hypothetical protein